MHRWHAFLFAFLLLPVGTFLEAQSRPVITIGVSEGADRTKNYGPLVVHLNAGKAYTYAFKSFDTAEQLLGALAARKVDLALIGPMNYVRAHDTFGAIPIVTDGKSYRSALIVPAASTVKTADSLVGRRLAFAYNQSSTGHLIPLLRLSRAGIRISTVVEGCAKRAKGATCYDFLGSHNAVAEAVRSGKYDAGGVIDEVAERTSGIRIIDRSDLYPAVPLVAHPKASKAMMDDVRSRILSYSAPPGTGTHPFAKGALAVTDADFNSVRFLAKVVLGEVFR